MYAQAAVKPNTLLRNGAYGIVMRGVHFCTRRCSSLSGRNRLPLCCIKLDTATDPENVTYLSWLAHEDINDTYKILNIWLEEYKNKNSYRWGITLKDTDELIGGIDVVDMMENRFICEIGYVLSRKHWNKGIMTEALKSVIQYLFDNVNFNRIQLHHDVDNPASGRVMTKCGMKFEGILRQYELKNTGELTDVAIYSILKNEK